MIPNPLEPPERLFYRDRLRNSRYAALADAEGFQEVCFAVESLGMRLLGRESTLNNYQPRVKEIALAAPSLSAFPEKFPMFFARFDSLYDIVRRARNDAMHIGSYARHATSAAVELCIGLEEAVMIGPEKLNRVSDFMVKTPVSIELWQPVAYARQLMLMHSFSFVPVFHDHKWKLLSEMAMVAFLRPKSREEREKGLALSIEKAVANDLRLLQAKRLKPDGDINKVVQAGLIRATPTLWLVVEGKNRLIGVLSPFELM